MNNTTKLYLKWGVIAGLATSVLGLIFYMFNISYNSKLSYISYAVLVGVIMAGSYEFRDKFNGGFAKFGELFKHAFMITLVYAVFTFFWSFIFMKFIGGEQMIADIIAQTRADMEGKGLDEQTISYGLEYTKKMMQPLPFALIGFIVSLIVGVLISLLTSSILRKEKQNDDLIIDEETNNE